MAFLGGWLFFPFTARIVSISLYFWGYVAT
jgi:hypothetical protein